MNNKVIMMSTAKINAVNVCGGSTLVEGGSDLMMLCVLYWLYYYDTCSTE